LFLLVLVIFGHRDIPLEDLKAKYGQPPSGFISINGMQVHYRDEGPVTDSIPLVLIHGTGSSLHTFNAWTNKLKETRRVIRMDLPGYGLTGPFPNRDYSMAHYLEFLAAFMKALSIKYCVLGGNSLGGGIAWRYTLQHPNTVHQLILIDASGYPTASMSRPLAFQLAELPIIKNIFTIVTPKFVARSSVENVYADPSLVSDSLVDRYFELTLRAGNRQAFADRLAVEHDPEDHKDIVTISQPTLILWGDKDALIPLEMAHRFHEDLRQSTLIVLKEVGHVPMEEQPFESLKAVRAFINR
jgi:pimeloyl-ACP methyl ester carboxylesterase